MTQGDQTRDSSTRRGLWSQVTLVTFVFRSGSGFEGDPVAEGSELSDVVTHAAFGVDAAGVVVGSEVVESGERVGQQVPDDDQDGAGDRDQGLELAASFDDPAVALAQEGVGSRGRGGSLAERAFQVGVALAGAAAR